MSVDDAMISPANRTRGGRKLELWDYGVSFLVTPFSLGIISPCFGDSNAKDALPFVPWCRQRSSLDHLLVQNGTNRDSKVLITAYLSSFRYFFELNPLSDWGATIIPTLLLLTSPWRTNKYPSFKWQTSGSSSPCNNLQLLSEKALHPPNRPSSRLTVPEVVFFWE